MRGFASKKTRETRRIEKLLGEHFERVDAYRQNRAAIRVRIIDPVFEGMSRIGREKRVLPIIAQLPKETRLDITMLLLLTPDELEESVANWEFRDPTPSRV